MRLALDYSNRSSSSSNNIHYGRLIKGTGELNEIWWVGVRRTDSVLICGCFHCDSSQISWGIRVKYHKDFFKMNPAPGYTKAIVSATSGVEDGYRYLVQKNKTDIKFPFLHQGFGSRILEGPFVIPFQVPSYLHMLLDAPIYTFHRRCKWYHSHSHSYLLILRTKSYSLDPSQYILFNLDLDIPSISESNNESILHYWYQSHHHPLVRLLLLYRSHPVWPTYLPRS